MTLMKERKLLWQIRRTTCEGCQGEKFAFAVFVLINDSRERYPDMSIFGLHGESLGSATSVAVLEFRPRIDFVVADCGFSEIINVMQGGLKNVHLPAWLVYPASLCTRLLYGYFYQQMRPIDSLKDNKIPILFIHGEEDDFILPWNSRVMREATAGYSEIHLIPGAGHAESVLKAGEDYKKYVKEFLGAVCK